MGLKCLLAKQQISGRILYVHPNNLYLGSSISFGWVSLSSSFEQFAGHHFKLVFLFHQEYLVHLHLINITKQSVLLLSLQASCQFFPLVLNFNGFTVLKKNKTA